MKWYMDKTYMKNHILSYVKFQLGQGYQLQDIKAALLKYGYDSSLIEEICSGIRPADHKPVKQKTLSIKELDEELYLYLQNLLVDYIKKEESQGYTREVIERALINYGHHPGMVKKAMKAAKSGMLSDFQPLDRLKFPGGLLLLFSIAVILFVVFLLSMMTGASLNVVIFSFLPSMVAVLLVYAIAANTSSKNLVRLLPIVSIAFAVAVFVAMLQSSLTMRKLSEPQTILLLNACLAFVLGSLICFFSKRPHKKITVQDIVAQAEPDRQADTSEAGTPKHAHHHETRSPAPHHTAHKHEKKRLKIKEF